MTQKKFNPPEFATTNSQLESCRSLINRVFKEEQFVSHQNLDMIPIKKCNSVLSGANKKMIMVSEENSNRVIGTLLLTINESSGTSLIQYFARDPEYKGTTVADSLMKFAEDYAKKMHQKKIQLSVAWNPLDKKIDKLINLYEQTWGYKYIGDGDRKAWDEIKKTLDPQYSDDTIFKYYEKALCRNNLKDRNFGKEDPQNLHSERGTIAERQGPSENANCEENPTQPKTDPSSCFGI